MCYRRFYLGRTDEVENLDGGLRGLVDLLWYRITMAMVMLRR